LVTGWAAATLRHRDTGWAEPLILHPERPIWDLPDAEAAASLLFSVLPPERAEAVALAVIRPLRSLNEGQTLNLVSGLMHPWSAELTREVLRRATSDKSYTVLMIREYLFGWVLRMHVGAALAVADAEPNELTPFQTDLLHHRHAMLEALKR
ncbi:MAG TPA: hypothetical protein VF771_21415, partial [Longimicrobiaceae bacterium]